MERYLLETCYLLTRDLYQIFITFFAMSFMLKPRYHRAICVSASVLYSFASEQLLLDGPPLLHGVGIALSFFLPALFLYKDKLMYRLFAAGFLAAGSIIMDVCVSGFVMLIDVNLLVSLKTFHTWDTIIMIIAMNFFFTGGFLLIMSVWNHFFRKSHVKSLGLFVMFPVSQFFFFCACAYQTWTGERLDLISNPFIIIAVVLSIAADILMYRALMQNTKTQELTQKLNDMQHEMDMQLQYYDGLADKMREIREYRHDINNLIEVTESLLRRKTTSEDGRMLLEELKEKTANAKMPVFSGNPTVNAILYHKQQTAKELGAEFRVNIPMSEDFPFERSDICSVFANLLDNAIREVSGAAEGFIEVSASRSMGLLLIKVRNSTSKVLNSEKGKPASDKSEPQKHGLGLEIVGNIAEKYDGKFLLTAENGTARAIVSLPIPESAAVSPNDPPAQISGPSRMKSTAPL